MNVGDKFPVNAFDTLKVESIGMTNVSGEMRRTIFFEHNQGFPQEFWIEGIGSNFNLLNRGINLETTADYSPYLECFHQDNELKTNLFPGESVCNFEFQTSMDCSISTASENLVKNEIDFEIYPNPASSFVRLSIKETTEKDFQLNVYDAFGRQVMHVSPIVAQSKEVKINQLAPGMYFLNLVSPENNDTNKL